MTPVVGVQAVAHRAVGSALRNDVQRGVDAQPALVHRFGAVSALEVFANFLNEVRREIVARRLDAEPQRLRLRLALLLRGYLAVALHQLQHEIAPRQCLLGVEQWRISGPANQRREHGGLRKRELPHRPAEIIFRGGFKAVVAVRQIHLVGIHRKDLLLGVVTLDLHGQQSFLAFPAEAAVRAVEKKAAGKLHRDGAGALLDAAADHVPPSGFDHARQVDAPVFEEMLVLGRGDGIFQDGRNLFPGQQDAPLQRERPDLPAIVRIKLGDHVGAVIFERANFGQFAGVHEEQPGARAKHDHQHQQKGECQAAGKLAPSEAQRNGWQTQHAGLILSLLVGRGHDERQNGNSADPKPLLAAAGGPGKRRR